MARRLLAVVGPVGGSCVPQQAAGGLVARRLLAVVGPVGGSCVPQQAAGGLVARRLLAVVVLAAGLALLAAGPAAAQEAPETERKYPNLDSTLRHLVERYEDQPSLHPDSGPPDAPATGAGPPTLVTAYLSGNVDEVVEWLQDRGIEPHNVGADYIETYVPLSLLGSLSTQSGIEKVRVVVPPHVDQSSPSPRRLSEAVTLHGADPWHVAGFDGDGVAVGIIDAGFQRFAELQKSGELPANVQARCTKVVNVGGQLTLRVTNDIADCDGGEAHGTGVAEAIIDMAPDVSLFIANTVTSGDVQGAVTWMAANGVDVINQSLSFTYDGPGDGTSIYTDSPLRAIDAAVTAGMVWTNSAGNGAGGVWFGEFNPSEGTNSALHNFGTSNAPDYYNGIGRTNGVTAFMRWDDDWGESDCDLDLSLHKANGSTVSSGDDRQNGDSSDVPYEFISYDSATAAELSLRISRHQCATLPDWIQLIVWSHDLQHSSVGHHIGNPAESANSGMLAVGASSWNDTTTIRPYSSNGPTADERTKPDIVAADGASSVIYDDFLGTSQSSPHTAGLAALVLSRFPDYTPSQVATYLKDSALQRDITPGDDTTMPDPNNVWGHGFASLPALSGLDYDDDDDGLIEVASLAALHAMRLDLDGNGAVTSGDAAGYSAGFPGAKSGMGCNEDAADAADQVCGGYELSSDLDFDINGDGKVSSLDGYDTDGDGDVDALDGDNAWWNSGAGWTPVGTAANAFAAAFEGNGHTISNLYIRSEGASGPAGLFGYLAAGAEISNVGMDAVDLMVTGSGSGLAGGLAASNAGTVSGSYADGSVGVTGSNIAGGLVGSNSGTVSGSYARATVSGAGASGGLAGRVSGGTVAESYANGKVTGSGAASNVGGLVGETADSGGTIRNSYAAGRVSANVAGASGGGLIGAKGTTDPTVTASYWNSESSGQSSSAAGTAKTTTELQTPTSNTGIYSGWSSDKWDFGVAFQAPLLKADWDGDGAATWQEFGYQFSNPGFAADAAIADQSPTQGVAYTSANAFPAVLGGNGTVTYSIAGLPEGLRLNSERKITGSAGAPLAKTSFDYTATDDGGRTDKLSFEMGVAPGAVDLAADQGSAGEGKVTLSWTANSGVAGWEYRQDSGSWQSILNSGDTTTIHTVTALTDGTQYTFEVRAYMGAGETRVDGVASNTVTVTAGAADTAPAFAGDASIADQALTQGVAYTSAAALAAAAGGDAPVTYSVTDPPSGLSVDSDRKITGTVTVPLAKAPYDYTATDGDGDKDSLSFNLSVRPKATTLTAAPGDEKVYFSWTAIPGVDGWQWGVVVQGVPAPLGIDIHRTDDTTTSYTLEQDLFGDPKGFVVRAYVGADDGRVDGVWSNAVTVDQSAPGAPASVSATAGDGQVALSWSAPSAGGAPATYQVRHKTQAGTWPSPEAWTDEPGTSHTFTGLSNGTAYTFEVRAKNELGTSAAVSSDATPALVTPTLAASPGNGAAHLSWAAVAGVSGWEYLQNEKDSTTNTAWAAITGSGAATTSHTVTGLDNTEEYDFKVRSYTGTGGSRVDGAESAKATVAPADQTPVLSGSIADQELTQGAPYTSATAFPEATGGDEPLAYSVASLPSGMTLNSERKLTGTATAPLAKTSLTYTVTDAAGDANNANDDDTPDTATLTFNFSVAAEKPANFTATAGDGQVTLGWTAIAGVSGWEVKQDSGNWTAVASSGAATNSHTVTGLTNGTSYTFRVRAFVGDASASPSTRVDGAESDAESATPAAVVDLVPVLTDITDKVFVPGTAVDETLPAATGGDGHPSYAYTLTPNVSGVGLTFTESTRTLGGTPSAPNAKVTYTYTATESSDSDGTTESATKTFTIGIQPKATTLSAAAGNGAAHLTWTAIAGVSGWEYLQNEDATTNTTWTAITGSGAATASHTVSGLTNSTEYTFRVRAFVGDGSASPSTRVDGAESAAASATPLPPVPAAPTGLGATAGDAEVTLRWALPTNTAEIDRVEVRHKPAATVGWAGIAWAELAKTAVAHTVTGLTNGTEYTFEVRAVNAAGDGPAASVDATPAAPPAPPPPPPTTPTTPTTPPPVTPPPATAVNTARSCPPDNVPPAGFKDLTGWPAEFTTAVNCIAAHGITRGTTPVTYSPKRPVTRSQVALFLTRIISEKQTLPAPGAAPNGWQGPHGDAATQLSALGIINLAEYTTAGPHTPITRGELALHVTRTLQHLKAKIPANPPQRFNDLARQSAAIALAARQLADAGIMIGATNTTFSPDKQFTRAQMALVLARTFTLLNITVS